MKKICTILSVFALITILLVSTSFAVNFEVKDNVNLNLVGEEGIMPLTDETEKFDFSGTTDSVLSAPVENPFTDADVDVEVKDELIINEDDLYEFGENVNHTGLTLDGNAYIFGETVTIKDSMINGNAFIFGGNVVLDNVEIYGSLYMFGENSNLKITTLDAYIAGTNVEFQKGTSIIRGLRVIGETVKIAANIDKNCYVMADNLDVSSMIVLGNFDYTAPEEVDLTSADVSGKVNYTSSEVEEEVETAKETFSQLFSVSKIISTAVGTLVISILIVLLSSKFVKVNQKENIAENLVKSFGIGLIALVVVPIVSIFVMLTIIGFGIGILLLLLYILVLVYSLSIVSLAISSYILKGKNQGKPAIIGVAVIVAAVLEVLYAIPAISGILSFIVGVIGLGLTIKTIFTKNVKEENIQVITEVVNDTNNNI